MGLTGSSFVKDSLGHVSCVSVILRVNGFPESLTREHPHIIPVSLFSQRVSI